VILELLDALRHRARRRRWNASQAEGRRGEDLAHRYLRKAGYTVVARNYRLPAGELDLVAWDGDTCAVVEVKTRASAGHGDPESAIDEDKRAALTRAAAAYARRAGIGWARIRFDIVTVIMSDPPRITLRKDAFRGRHERRPGA
jgi:putative endonuclease